MNLIHRASRSLTFSAPLLCALFLLVLAAPLCAAGTGPIITSAAITPATLPLTGGVITVSANITASTGAVISSVTAIVTLTGSGNYFLSPNGNGKSATLTLSNGGSGNIYTGNISSNGVNTTISPFTYTATITATDNQSPALSTSATASGQTVQANDIMPPIIGNATITPSALPSSGGAITVSANITDPAGRPITSATTIVTLTGNANYSLSPNGNSKSATLTLSNGGSGSVFTGNISSNIGNPDTASYTYTATLTAANDLGLTSTATASGQTVQADKTGAVPTASSGITHIMWNNADGRLSLWNYDPLSGGFSQITYGPYAGWAAKAVADGPDGKTRVLWDNTNGTMSLWSLDNTTGIFTQNSFGPYPGWTATSLSVAP